MKDKCAASLFVAVAVVALIVVRLFAAEDAPWIGLINYAGLAFAVYTLADTVVSEYRGQDKVATVRGFFILSAIPLIVVAALIFTGSITLDARANDLILLITLLVSLPTRFYVYLAGLYINKD